MWVKDLFAVIEKSQFGWRYELFVSGRPHCKPNWGLHHASLFFPGRWGGWCLRSTNIEGRMRVMTEKFLAMTEANHEAI